MARIDEELRRYNKLIEYAAANGWTDLVGVCVQRLQQLEVIEFNYSGKTQIWDMDTKD